MSLREQIAYLEQAVALDSTFFDAWASLSIANSRLIANGGPNAEVSRRAKDALDHAMTLNPQNYRTNLAAARYHELVSRDYAQADAAIERALQAAPSDAEVLASASLTDQRHGDRDAAVAKLERARETRPPVILHASATGRPLCRAAPLGRRRGGVQHGPATPARRPGR